MTQKEFEDRTRRLIAVKEYYLVNNLYMAAGDMTKDEFCEEMRRMCAYDGVNNHIELRKCLKEIGQYVGARDAELSFLKKTVTSKNMELAEFLIGKACAYEDTDFYHEAVKLIGQCEVVLMKLRMNLPLWEEDKDYIKKVLENDIQGRKVAG